MRIAFVPSPPFLLPGFSGGPDGLREAVAAAVAKLDDPVTVVAAAPEHGPAQGSVDPTPWGARGEPTPDPLPLGLAIGATLLGTRPHALVGLAEGDLAVTGDLLVVGDGTAKRTLKAPGHLDERAEAYDARIEAALASGRPEQLLALDPGLGADLWAAGVPVWQAVARTLPPYGWEAQVLWAGAPFGVGYVVATWLQVP